jgi:hypothetical protein
MELEMKKVFAGLGVLALVALGTTGATFPAMADVVQPVAEIVVQSDAIVASPDAVLSQSEPVVTTTAVEVPAEPVAVVAEPVEAPVAPAEPVVVPEPVVAPVEPVEAPVAAPEPVAVVDAPAVDPYSGNPIVDCEALGLARAEDFTCVPLDYWVTPDGSRMAIFQGDGVEAFQTYQLDVPELSLEEQNESFGGVYRGVYVAGYAPADTLSVPTTSDASKVYAYNLR